MFTKTAHLYDIIYSFKDYKKESGEILDLIRAKHPEAKTILDIGCGTSEHHKYLNSFSIDGIDLNEKFIRISKKKNPSGTYSVANMKDFDLSKEYDVIICLFSSIGYLENKNEILSALKSFHKHLRPGGLLILEPWFNKSNLFEPKVFVLNHDSENLKICRMNRSYVSGDYSIVNFHYLIGTKEEGVQHFEEEHKLRLTSKEEFFEVFNLAGFDVIFDEKGLIGRGMYYAVKKV